MKILLNKKSKILIVSFIVIILLIIISIPTNPKMKKENEIQQSSKININQENIETAILAGGCFWCIEASLEQINGIISVQSGYTGGELENPTYEKVSTGQTGHYEAVQVTYDKTKITYKQVLEKFFELFDPTDDTGQFSDKGSQYKSAIFYKNENEQKIAKQVIQELEKSKIYNKPIVTKLIKNQTFYLAEDYHQDYYKKSPLNYNTYKKFSGREQYYDEIKQRKQELNLTK